MKREYVDNKMISRVLQNLHDGRPKSPEELGVSRHNLDKIADKGYITVVTEPRGIGGGRGAPRKKFVITPKGKGYLNLFSLGMMFIEQLDDLGDMFDAKFGILPEDDPEPEPEIKPRRRGRPPRARTAEVGPKRKPARFRIIRRAD